MKNCENVNVSRQIQILAPTYESEASKPFLFCCEKRTKMAFWKWRLPARAAATAGSSLRLLRRPEGQKDEAVYVRMSWLASGRADDASPGLRTERFNKAKTQPDPVGPLLPSTRMRFHAKNHPGQINKVLDGSCGCRELKTNPSSGANGLVRAWWPQWHNISLEAYNKGFLFW